MDSADSKIIEILKRLSKIEGLISLYIQFDHVEEKTIKLKKTFKIGSIFQEDILALYDSRSFFGRVSAASFRIGVTSTNNGWDWAPTTHDSGNTIHWIKRFESSALANW